MSLQEGKLIVIDGIDGSGKTTQIDLLTKYLKDKNIPYEVINFPRYEQNLYADLVSRYLKGEFGDINNVNPYLIALAYAGDRLLAKPLTENWLKSGKVVIANRYVSSSKAHLGANLPEDQREKFIKWLDELEYGTNKMPKEDLTIFLKLDPKMGQRNVASRHTLDIHEKSIEHEEKASKIYFELSKMEKNWMVVNCMEGDKINKFVFLRKMRPIEDIHQDILKIINGKIIGNQF